MPTGELEGLPAPLSGVLPDLSFSRDDADKTHSTTSSLATIPAATVARSFRRHCQILSAQGRGPSAARERVGRLAVATAPGLAPDFSRTCRLPPRHGQEVRFAVDSPLEESGFEPSVPLGEERSFRNARIRELHHAAYRGGRKRYRRGRPSGSRRSDHSNTATASELQVRPVG
jgi:hypothetical protein